MPYQIHASTPPTAAAIDVIHPSMAAKVQLPRIASTICLACMGAIIGLEEARAEENGDSNQRQDFDGVFVSFKESFHTRVKAGLHRGRSRGRGRISHENILLQE